MWFLDDWIVLVYVIDNLVSYWELLENNVGKIIWFVDKEKWFDILKFLCLKILGIGKLFLWVIFFSFSKW